MIQLEIACFNSESAIIAAQAGADRIELCDGIEVGGTTPDLETTQKVLTQVPIPVYVMVRPRGGDFVYTDAEFQAMKDSIADFKKMQVHGLVFGILKEEDTLDEERNRLRFTVLLTVCPIGKPPWNKSLIVVLQQYSLQEQKPMW